MHDDERVMLRSSLRRLLVETDTAKLAPALDEFGWPDVLAADPAEAVSVLFETQGETVISSPALNAVMALPLLGNDADPAGVGDWTVVLPGPGSPSPAGYALTAGAPLERCLLVTGQNGAAVLDVVHAENTEPRVARPVEGIDPWLGLVAVTVTAGAPVERRAAGEAVSAAWECAVAAGRRALTHELIGVSRAMLALAADHARERRQFGQPIGAFQAVKHRLAEAKVALTASEAAVAEAWADPGPFTALLAKLWAGRAARLTGKQAQQVLGGMGFTWEHPFHRHFRRALVLDSLLGSTTELQHPLGRSLLTTGDVPRLARL
jgi:hypothetical protein